jgi:pimeloyl-ACP methyl ester carboxylesterase
VTITITLDQSRVDLTIRDVGHGEPVLILHGGTGPASIDPLIEHLAGSYRVLAPTHPGFDGTVLPSRLGDVRSLAAVYLALCDHLALTGITVIGSSFGGWVATEIAAADLSRRVSRLVLIDGIGPQIPGHPVIVPAAPPGTAANGLRRGGPPPAAMAALRAYGGAQLQDSTLLERCAAVAIPVLVLWGDDDPIVSPGFGRAYADAFPHSRFELIPGGGHVPMRQAPELTFAAIDTFLQE